MAEETGSMGGGEDLYSADADPKPETPAKEGEGEDQSDSEEAILPKSILAGKEFNVGDEVVLKITAIHDGQISVKYAPSKPEGESEGEGEAKAEMPSEMAAGGSGGGDSMYD